MRGNGALTALVALPFDAELEMPTLDADPDDVLHLKPSGVSVVGKQSEPRRALGPRTKANDVASPSYCRPYLSRAAPWPFRNLQLVFEISSDIQRFLFREARSDLVKVAERAI